MEEAYDYLLSDCGIKYGDTIIAAISGGPDSMALLHMLIRLKRALDLDLVCAHVNHNTGRIGQKEEQKYVEKYCKANSVIFETLTIENYGDDNFENEARIKRYTFFEELIKKYEAKYLFTAHHGDDLMETILMRITRGASLKGYSGFSKVVHRGTYKIIRPLIELTKEDLIKYNEEYGIKYYVDKTNLEDIHTRNRYRKYILPALKNEDPNVHKKFLKFSKTLLEYNEYIDKQVKKKINSIYINNVLNIPLFLKEEKLIQMKIINYILEQIYQDDLMLITDRHSEIIYEVITSNKANVKVHLPNNIQAIKSYDSLTLGKIKEKNNDYEMEITKNVNLPNGKNIEMLEESDKNTNFYCRLDSSEVKLPLYVRNRKAGDKMTVKGMIGRKNVNDIFIDSKVPLAERDVWPVVVDSNENIVWLPGLKKTKFDKPKSEKCDIILRYY